MNKEYLFLLDPYCFIWKDCDQILLYNTLSGKGYIYMNDVVLSDFINQLMMKDNLYCISLTSSDLSNSTIANFIYSARDNFCGDLLQKNDSSGKPIVIIPEVNINEDVNRNLDEINNSAVFGSTILKNLTDIYLELGGKCQFNCKDCQSIHKQIEWCCSLDPIMPIEIVKKIFEEIKYANVFDIHLTSGNILEYPYWDDLIILISSYSEKFRFNFNINSKYLQRVRYRNKIEELVNLHNINFVIYIDESDITQELHKQISSIKNDAELVCKISNDEQYIRITKVFENSDMNIRILPYYTGCNLSFFKKYIFQEKDDILNSHLSKKDIFAHQLVNTNHFGKLYIRVNGDVCSNVNAEPLGHHTEGILKFVYEELKNGTFWRKTRDQVEPCNNCIYRYLCPSPSNYEEVIGKFNLCHIRE